MEAAGIEPCQGNLANLLMAHDFGRNPLAERHLPPHKLPPGVHQSPLDCSPVGETLWRRVPETLLMSAAPQDGVLQARGVPRRSSICTDDPLADLDSMLMEDIELQDAAPSVRGSELLRMITRRKVPDVRAEVVAQVVAPPGTLGGR